MSVTDERYEDLDFDTLESAVRQSPKGNWFLEEYARRLRSGETTSILDAISKLERVITSQGSAIEPPRREAPVPARQLRYFKKDEEIFEEVKPEPAVKAVEPPPPVAEAKPQAASEQRGARLRIMRMEQPAVVDPFGPQAVQLVNKPPEAAAVQPPAPEPEPAPAPAPAPAAVAQKQRIIISRHATPEDLAIPLVEDSATLTSG